MEEMTIDQAKENIARAEKRVRDFKELLWERRREEWLFSGRACERCNGTGTVLTWGTLDSMSGGYDEFGICPECKGRSQAWAGSNRNRKSQHPHVQVPPLVSVALGEQDELDALEEDLGLARVLLKDIELAWAPRVGERVEVLNGRGSRGGLRRGMRVLLEWRGVPRGQSREKARVRLDGGEVGWISPDNLRATAPAPRAKVEELNAERSRALWVRANVGRGAYIIGTSHGRHVEGAVKWEGVTRRGHWAARVEGAGYDGWLEAQMVERVNGRTVDECRDRSRLIAQGLDPDHLDAAEGDDDWVEQAEWADEQAAYRGRR